MSRCCTTATTRRCRSGWSSTFDSLNLKKLDNTGVAIFGPRLPPNGNRIADLRRDDNFPEITDYPVPRLQRLVELRPRCPTSWNHRRTGGIRTTKLPAVGSGRARSSFRARDHGQSRLPVPGGGGSRALFRFQHLCAGDGDPIAAVTLCLIQRLISPRHQRNEHTQRCDRRRPTLTVLPRMSKPGASRWNASRSVSRARGGDVRVGSRHGAQNSSPPSRAIRALGGRFACAQRASSLMTKSRPCSCPKSSFTA